MMLSTVFMHSLPLLIYKHGFSSAGEVSRCCITSATVFSLPVYAFARCNLYICSDSTSSDSEQQHNDELQCCACYGQLGSILAIRLPPSPLFSCILPMNRASMLFYSFSNTSTTQSSRSFSHSPNFDDFAHLHLLL